MVTVIDYGVGNLFSLASSLTYIGAESRITSDFQEIEAADRIILPGVGAFGDAMAKLRGTGLIPAVMAAAGRGVPLLGICVGMQMLFEESLEYGRHKGLGLLRGRVCPLEDDLRAGGFDLKVPQMGWNSLKLLREDCPILRYTQDGDFAYYVHSYYAKGCEDAAAVSEYGVSVPGVVWRENIYGTQFHPEKSGDAGLRVLRAFCNL